MKKQNILFIDIGNTSIKWSSRHAHTVNILSEMSQQIYPENNLSNFFVTCFENLEIPEQVYVSSVAAQHVMTSLKQACNKLWNIEVYKVNATKEIAGLVNSYIDPSELGSDRWCGMLGALNAVSSDFLLVSCGSAITLDVVNSSGNHLGGYILPGLFMMKKCLSNNTELVNVDLKPFKPTVSPANTTVGCIESASYLSVITMIEAVYLEQAKISKNLRIVLTGGDASLIADNLTIECVMMPDVVLQGLAVLVALD